MPPIDLKIQAVRDGDGLEAVKQLWRSYWAAMNLPPDFQGFSQEIEGLPGRYCVLLLATVEGIPVGTVGMRPLRDEACEAKRLYVAPEFRRIGLARALLARVIDEARALGYRELYGDTLPSMSAAMKLYRELGFRETGAYSDDPTPGAVYLRLPLTPR